MKRMITALISILYTAYSIALIPYTHSIKNESNDSIKVTFVYHKPDKLTDVKCPKAEHTVRSNSTLTTTSTCRLKEISVRCRGYKFISADAQDDTESYKRYIQAPPWANTVGTGWIYRHTSDKKQQLIQEFGTQIMNPNDA